VRSGLFTRGPRLWGRRWPYVAAGFVLLTVSAAALTVTLSWSLDVLGGHTQTRAVITVNPHIPTAKGHSADPDDTLARTDGGTPLDLEMFGTDDLYTAANVGDPVVVTRSAITGDVTAVRTSSDYIAGFDNFAVIFVDVLGPLLLLFVTVVPVRKLLHRIPKRFVIGVPAVAFATMFVVLLALSGPEAAMGQQPPPSATALNDPSSPTTVVGSIEKVTTANISVVLDGPMSHRPPTGAASWLDDFAVISIPVTATLLGPNSEGDHFGSLQTSLIGEGIGNANGVDPADCSHQSPSNGFGDGITLDQLGPRPGVLCFVVPTRFRPHYLVLTDVFGDKVNAIDLTRTN
jgi:hypothetical protein